MKRQPSHRFAALATDGVRGRKKIKKTKKINKNSSHRFSSIARTVCRRTQSVAIAETLRAIFFIFGSTHVHAATDFPF